MIWTSSHPPLSPVARPLDEHVFEVAATRPDAVALVDGPSGAEITFGTLAERIGAVAGALDARGFGRGDVLALWAPNVPAWAGVALGAMACGGAVTGIPPGVTEDDAARQLADSGATVLVTLERDRTGAEAAAARAGVPLVTTPAELVADGRTMPAVEGRSLDDLALLPYSSGTTGLPKGVMLSQRALVSGVEMIRRAMAFGPGDALLNLPPLAHVMGFVVTLAAPLVSGARVVTVPQFKPEAFLALVQRHRINVLTVPPPVMGLLASHPLVDRFDLSSVEIVVSGGAPLGAGLQRAVAERLGVPVGQGWGLTECTIGGTGPDREAGTLPGSVGRLLPSNELRVVDPGSGRDAEVGELCLRGPQLMTGYLGRPGATAEMIDTDGWLHTGDLGRVDADGNIFVVDRLKELIKVDARQVAPAELEALLLGHPAVADAAVTGRPHERHGEVPVAFVVARGELDPESLLGWVAERVAPYRRLREVTLVDELPRTPAGKLLRRRLLPAGGVEPLAHRRVMREVLA